MEAILDSIKTFGNQANEDTRRLLSSALRDLAVSFETQNDTMVRVIYQPLELMVVYIAYELGLFKLMSSKDKNWTADELAVLTSADVALLNRILRYLASFRFIQETGRESYCATQATRTFARPGFEDGVWFYFRFFTKCIMSTPDVLKDAKYQNITSSTHTPFQRAFQTELPPFVWMQQQQDYLSHFVKFMSEFHEGKAVWTSVVSIQQECSIRKSASPLFVDVGGGLGFQCVAFQLAAEGIPGRIINQDLKETLDQAPPHDGVEKMVHDFFTSQPIKGAKYYFLRNILHDYHDERALGLLNPLVEAMDSESVMLINEQIVPDIGAHRFAVQQDMAMMIALGAVERTESQWRALLTRAGLMIQKLSTYEPLSGDSVIEAVLMGVNKH